MTPEQTHILDAVARVRDDKRKNRRIPTFCLGVELSRNLGPERAQAARETLKELESEGLVRIGQTINDYYVEIIDPAESPEPESNETSSTQ